MIRRLLLAPLMMLLLAACGVSGAVASQAPAPSRPSRAPVLTQAAEPSPIPTAPPAAEPATPAPAPPAPSTNSVAFSGLAPGTYPVHLHSICNGRQSFHIAYLPNLGVGAGGAGSIDLPAADFGRGWCVVVYANAALTRVAAFRSI